MNLVTWNTQWCCGNDGVVSPKRIVDGAFALAGGHLDVLCLQEIASGFPRLEGGVPGDQAAQLLELLRTRSSYGPDWKVFFGTAVNEWDAQGRPRQFGNLIATRLPVLQVQHHPLPYPPDAAVRSMPRMCSVATVRDAALGPVRVMTTHLEFYSLGQRAAQARALRELQLAYAAQALNPPWHVDDGTPFETRTHTVNAVLCGDFNLEAGTPDYAAIVEEAPPSLPGATLHDAWRTLHGSEPQPPTFHVHNDRYSKVPIACDFVFVSGTLAGRVKRMAIDGDTQVSDHQPVLIEL